MRSGKKETSPKTAIDMVCGLEADEVRIEAHVLKQNAARRVPQIHKPSNEQQAAIQAIRSYNVAVDAVAGSGKTTTCLHISRAYPDKNILLLTYNAKLRLETQARFDKHSVTNATVHTYHSFVRKYYDPSGYTDSTISGVISCDTAPINPFSYSMIIIDEIQDINPLYYELICKLYADNTADFHPYVVIFGDKKQCIYDFKKADERYLTLANRLFTYSAREWINKPMSCSFRITKQMANFVNRCMLKTDRLLASKEILKKNKTPVKPVYMIYDRLAGMKWSERDRDYYPIDESQLEILNQIKKYITLGYSADDFLIIAYSVKTLGSPVRSVANCITEYFIKCSKDSPNYETYKKYPLYVSASDDAPSPSEKVTKGKILMCTYHQAKGLERKVVFVMGFDNSFYVYFNKTTNPTYCPNILYVAATRSLEHLVLCHSRDMHYLPFLDKDRIAEHCDIIGAVGFPKSIPETDRRTRTVMELLNHLSFNVVDDLNQQLRKIQIRAKDKYIFIPNEIKQPYGFEEVSEITGTAIPAYLEFTIRQTCKIYEEVYNRKYQYQKLAIIEDEPVNLPEDVQISEHDDQIDGQLLGNLTLGGDVEVCIDDADDITAPPALPPKPDMKTFYEDLKRPDTFYAMLDSNDPLKLNKLLSIATQYCSYMTGYHFKNAQIKNFGWLTELNLYRCLDRFKRLNISSQAQFEYGIYCSFTENKNGQSTTYETTGSMDCIDGNNIYEFKCVKELKPEHFLQLAVYMFMHQTRLINDYCGMKKITPMRENVPPRELNKYQYLLYNILTDELQELVCSYEVAKHIVITLHNEKRKNIPKCNDEEFITSNLQLTKKY